MFDNALSEFNIFSSIGSFVSSVLGIVVGGLILQWINKQTDLARKIWMIFQFPVAPIVAAVVVYFFAEIGLLITLIYGLIFSVYLMIVLIRARL